jgi:Gram-negative bacterial TonB protein C-terminal
MRTKKILCEICFGVLIGCFASTEVHSQSRSRRGVRANEQKVTLGKKAKPKIISFGVLNGKAINLVRPEYPPTASSVNISGPVYIGVLIDTEGKITSAWAHRGHPLLIPASIKAARASTFEPITYGGRGKPTLLYGLIVYNYLPSSLNWLELGYAADSVDTLIDHLPVGFGEVREFLEQSRSNPDARESILNSAWGIIIAKLVSNEKAQWLIAVGRQIRILTGFHWDTERKDRAFAELKVLFDTKPTTVSPNLASRIDALIDPEQQSKFNENLLNLTEKLFVLGN